MVIRLESVKSVYYFYNAIQLHLNTIIKVKRGRNQWKQTPVAFETVYIAVVLSTFADYILSELHKNVTTVTVDGSRLLPGTSAKAVCAHCVEQATFLSSGYASRSTPRAT